MIKNVFVCIVLFITATALAQKPIYKSYNWEKEPSFKVPEAKDEKIATLKHAVVAELYMDRKEELTEYFLEHEVLWLNSNEKIEEYNKIYLPYSNTSKIVVNKARVISKDGKITEIDPSKIFESKNEETGALVQYFALEGIEKGSIVEHIYVYERSPKINGNRISLQNYMPKNNVTFDLYAPSHLDYKFKSYNGAPEVTKMEDIEDRNHWGITATDFTGVAEEEVSAYWASTAFLVYVLDGNTAAGTVGITSYSTLVKRLFPYYYPEHSKRTQRNIEKFAKDAIGNSKETEEKIRSLDRYIKSNVYLSDSGSDDAKDIDEILKNKVANETGVLRLYITLLTSLGIEHEMVITSDRQHIKFDKNFEAYNFLSDFLIYFPEFNTYLSPTEYETRYGFPPPFLTDNYGLFIKKVKLGDYTSGVGEIKYIQPNTADQTVDNMLIDISFEKDNISKIIVDYTREMGGYYSSFIQPFIHLVKKEDKDELMESFIKNINENVTINSKEIVNGKPELFGIKPFTIVLNYDSEAFVEKAGNKYLFKIGELISKQIEMYQESERVLDVEERHTRTYLRTITMEIPEGYEIANPDDINIKHEYSSNGEPFFSFHSHYKIEDNLLTITADEYYHKNKVDVSLYEEYRKVVNSAADFNKITLVLQPVQ
ncbi:DUF3857 domain-containing protein [Marinirhabdus gelatinilytica]|uniref:Uncharacterized protein DUF3857 n=1 Tax=Marinirhabdus gelatinilytica TaxID=1703343 RepID=A0A370QK26_9FLAO|nr:DUF3857 domain-containing protein [Marinirhabdus gelatinilytica]RDK88669.1 uncharacterized protein DUF3857 [Marinirhabdus gelatinilytica]